MKSRTLIHAAIAAVILVTLSGCSGAETRKARFVERGEQFMAERDYTKARLEFRNALQIDPKDRKAQTLAGEAAEKLGDFREAVGMYRAALTDGNNVEARRNLSKLLVMAGAPDDARKLAEEGLTTNANDATLLAVRGASKLVKKDVEGARADAEAALKIEPANEDAAALMASIYGQSGEKDKAIALIEGVAKQKPKSMDMPLILAQLYATSGRDVDSEAQLKKMVELDSKTLAHRYRLAQYQTMHKRIDAAEATLRDAVKAAPEDVDAKLALANLIATQRSFEDGEKSLKALVAADAKDLQLKLGLAKFYETHNKRPQAEGVYKEVMAADEEKGPRGIAARNRLAALALADNRPDDAKKYIEEVITASPRDNDALAMRANLALARNDAPAAITDLRAVLRDQPRSQPLMRALAQAYQANGDTALVEETLRSAVQINPRDIPTRLALAKFLIDSNRADEAQPVADQLVKDQPGDVPSLEAAFRVQIARRDLAGARQTAGQIQSLQPNAPMGFYLAGLVDEADGKLDSATQNVEKALERAPGTIEPLTVLVRLDLNRKQPEKAISRIDAAIIKNPDAPVLRQLKADTLMTQRRWDDAVAASEETIRVAPKWWQPYVTQGRAYLASKNMDKAVATYQKGVESSGAAPAIVTELATLQERLGKPDQSIAIYEDWLKRDPKADIAANNLAMLLITHRAKDQAALKRALDLSHKFQNSTNAALLDTYAWVRYVRGEYTQAVPPLQRAVDLAPKTPALRARLGLAQKGAGQADPARKNLQEALAAQPQFPGREDAEKALKELGS